MKRKFKIMTEVEVEIDFPYYFKYIPNPHGIGNEPDVIFGKIDDENIYTIFINPNNDGYSLFIEPLTVGANSFLRPEFKATQEQYDEMFQKIKNLFES